MLKKISLMTVTTVMFVAVLGCARSSDNNNNNTGADTSGVTTIVISEGSTGRGPAAYGTNPLHLPLGAKVVWRNDDDETHTATSDTGIWDTGRLTQGKSSSAVSFDRAGTFPYHCTTHGRASMSGVIIVP
jgi:plastocyanin